MEDSIVICEQCGEDTATHHEGFVSMCDDCFQKYHTPLKAAQDFLERHIPSEILNDYPDMAHDLLTEIAETDKANAKLIAAAPELLSACRYALSVLDSIPTETAETIMDGLDEEIDAGMVREAIYKATGN